MKELKQENKKITEELTNSTSHFEKTEKQVFELFQKKES